MIPLKYKNTHNYNSNITLCLCIVLPLQFVALHRALSISVPVCILLVLFFPLPEVDVPGLEDEVVDQAVHDTAPQLHLSAVRAFDQGLHVVCCPVVKLNRLLVVETLVEGEKGGRGRGSKAPREIDHHGGIRWLTS